MNKELIKITTNEKGEQLVSARELHEFLGLSKRFSAWFETYSNGDYGFSENIDYVECTQSYIANQYGAESERKDYALSIGMAKELCMLSKSEKGRQARKYFIECEKALKENLIQLNKSKSNNVLSENTIKEMFSMLPDSEKTEAMLKLVDRFYPIGNNNAVQIKYEPESNKPKLNYDLFKKVLNDCYEKAYIDNKVHKGVEYVVIDKKIIEHEFYSIGINTKELNRFIRENKPCVKAQIRHGEEYKNKWEYFCKKELFE